MEPSDFKKEIFKQLDKIDQFIECDDYHNNPYSSFKLKIKNCFIAEGFFILTINESITFFCNELNFNGFTDDLEISDKYSNLNGVCIGKVKVSSVERIDLEVNAIELLL